MTYPHSVPNCRWGQPTLLLQRPYWFQAVDHEWSCAAGTLPRILQDPATCHTCPAWVPAEPATFDPAVRQDTPER
jgi:hypothetical protein